MHTGNCYEVCRPASFEHAIMVYGHISSIPQDKRSGKGDSIMVKTMYEGMVYAIIYPLPEPKQPFKKSPPFQKADIAT